MDSVLSMSQNSSSSSTHPPLQIAIVGAGIGGLALAIGLNKRNVPYTVYESAPTYATVGAGVGLGPNALRAMDMIDSRFRGQYDAVATGNLTPEKANVMMEALLLEEGLGANQGWEPKTWGAKNYTRTAAHRKVLLDIMTSFIPKQTVKFNKKVLEVKQLGDSVSLVFEDGEIIEASTVIGCDGIKGATRGFVLGKRYPEQVEPKYEGLYAYRAIIPMDEARAVVGDMANDAKMFFGHKANFSTYTISKGREINVIGFVRDDKPWPFAKVTHEVSREEMIADFEEHNADRRLLKLLDWAKPVRWAMFHHPETATYHNDLVCLLGDSAHATLPNQAAGAGQGLEDALIMARLLDRVQSTFAANSTGDRVSMLRAAFTAYEEMRLPRAQKQVETSIECGLMYNRMHPEIGHDMEKTIENMNGRFAWLWDHDLEGDVRVALARFDELVAK